ncbi:hypothetical protein C8F01DRAFT_770650 [Mycena amicta]|nr:hypothetical protein C8F01DRAFT_770650 [Mycena amicta]
MRVSLAVFVPCSLLYLRLPTTRPKMMSRKYDRTRLPLCLGPSAASYAASFSKAIPHLRFIFDSGIDNGIPRRPSLNTIHPASPGSRVCYIYIGNRDIIKDSESFLLVIGLA